MPETTIFFVRHGEVHNPGAIFYGRLPRFRLSEAGRQQAAAAARSLAGVPLAAVYTSPLLRARQTAAIVAREHPGITIATSRLLLEIRTARQGETVAALDATDWNFYEPPLSEDDETMRAIHERIARFCRLVVRRRPGRAVAAVTHGDIVAIARAGFEGLPLALASIRGARYPATASIFRVTLTPDLVATAVSDWRPAAAAG